MGEWRSDIGDACVRTWLFADAVFWSMTDTVRWSMTDTVWWSMTVIFEEGSGRKKEGEREREGESKEKKRRERMAHYMCACYKTS